MKKLVSAILILVIGLCGISAFAEGEQNYDMNRFYANAVQLLPGTKMSDMINRYGETAAQITLSQGTTSADFVPNANGDANFYLSTNSSDIVEIAVTDKSTNETVVKIYVVPRTYNAYTVGGLDPNCNYSVGVKCKSDGTMLIY